MYLPFKFQFIALIALWAMAFFKCRGYGLPRRFAPRNDSIFVTLCTEFSADRIENRVIARLAMQAVAIRFPAMQSIALAEGQSQTAR